jgi:hypothetical protein
MYSIGMHPLSNAIRTAHSSPRGTVENQPGTTDVRDSLTVGTPP